MAYADAEGPAHALSLALQAGHPGPLIVSALVVAEAARPIARRAGRRAEVPFLGELSAGAFTVEPVRAMDWERIAELVARHRDMRLGTVDASVAATAERFGTTIVATIDRRHFSAVRPRHVDAFALPLPE